MNVYGPPMHEFVLTEAEVGYRAAVWMDSADCDPWWCFREAAYWAWGWPTALGGEGTRKEATG